MKRPINRNDVAKRAGVAPSTVSHAMNGTKFVSEAVKARVFQAVNELDYEPNLLAKSVRVSSTRQISVLISALDNFDEFYRGMYEVAFEAGYRLSVIIANDKRADYYGNCYAYRSEGIVNMSRFFCSEQNYRKFIEHEIAVVNVISGKDSFEVSLNYAPAIEAFVQDLKRKNRSRVAFIADTSKTEIEPDTRYIAMRYDAEKYGVGFEESLLRCFEENTVTLNPSEFGYRSIADILQNRSDVDAVYCVNDYIAMGVYKYLFEIGKKIPQDISVCGCDNILSGEYTCPALSTMSVDRAEFGRSCMKSILSQLHGDKNLEKKRILYASYLPRQSV